ncbi:MAG: phosphatidylethanolamine-binding protein [Lachnospiraceae bacterium]|nr:phosphatidylethanolamine-binding protein [Lachnospiraceae bacterium]
MTTNLRAYRISFFLITVILLLGVQGCAGKGIEQDADRPQFELSSDDLHEGIWDTVITNTSYGQNASPQLSWEPVDGAECYAIYMIDTSARNWMHWKMENVAETELPRGSASNAEYVGPYPPSGTHDYEIYVYALKAPVSEIGGDFDKANPDYDEIVRSLDKNGGNILACGHLKGTYTNGE